MTKVFKVDANNDLYIAPDGQLAIGSALDAVMQACAHAAKAQDGEMMFAADAGMPNFQAIWNGSPNIPQFIAALKRTLSGVDGVLEVTAISASISNNVLSYSATIKTIYGEAYLNNG